VSDLNADADVTIIKSVECSNADQSDAFSDTAVECDTELDSVPECKTNADNIPVSTSSVCSLVSDDFSVSAILSDKCASEVNECTPTVAEMLTRVSTSSVQGHQNVRVPGLQEGYMSRFGRLVKPVNRLIQTMSTQRVHAIHDI